jgi:hypothetical protein
MLPLAVEPCIQIWLASCEIFRGQGDTPEKRLLHIFFSLVIISPSFLHSYLLEAGWNVMAHAHKPDFVFHWNGRVHLNRRGRQFSRLLAAEVCASVVVMLDTPCSGVVWWRVLATHSIRQFPLHFPFCLSPCAITLQLESAASSSAWLLWAAHFHISDL